MEETCENCDAVCVGKGYYGAPNYICENEYSECYMKSVLDSCSCGSWRRKLPYVLWCEWQNNTLFISIGIAYHGNKLMRNDIYINVLKPDTDIQTGIHSIDSQRPRSNQWKIQNPVELHRLGVPGYSYRNTEKEARKYAEWVASEVLELYKLDLKESWSKYPKWLTTSYNKEGLQHLWISAITTACGKHFNKFNKKHHPELKKCRKCLEIQTKKLLN